MNPDRCIIRLALILPQSPTLNIGDTLTLRAQFNQVSADCLPTDTTAGSLRWATASEGALDVIVIDSLTAHVTALKAGQAGVTARAKFKKGYADVGIASVTVAEP